eukprot:1069450-Amphidinium_carterae.1
MPPTQNDMEIGNCKHSNRFHGMCMSTLFGKSMDTLDTRVVDSKISIIARILVTKNYLCYFGAPTVSRIVWYVACISWRDRETTQHNGHQPPHAHGESLRVL